MDVRRQRLLRLLSDDPAPVTLVCGPAGSGKSSLLATWAATSGDDVIAWLGVERHDDDPGQLWTSVLEAFRATGRFGADAPLQELAAPPGEVSATFVETVLGEVAALDRPTWLVLDDVHLLQRSTVLDSLGMLIRLAPPGVRLVLSGRAEPEVGLPRLQVRGWLREVRAEDLAFSPEETATFLERQQVELAPASRELLHCRTEGWIAGLRIAAMALSDDPHPDTTVERFGGDDRALADYFLTEVVASLPPQRLEFLAATSVCANVSVALARRLSGRDDSAEILDELVRSNLFIRRLGRGREDHRYHELLRSYFSAELDRRDPARSRELHGIAASWHLDGGDSVHAMEHLVRSGDTDRLVVVAARHGLSAVHRGQAQRVGRMLAGLGPEQRSVPALALLGAAAALEAGELDDADRWLLPLPLAGLTPERDDDARFAAAVSVARARFTRQIDEPLTCLEAKGEPTGTDPDHELYVRYHRGVARLYVGRYDDAIDDLERAATLARVAGYDAMELAAASFLAGTLAGQSRWPEARQHADHAVALAQRRGWARTPSVAHMYMLLGWSDYQQGDTPGATAHAALAVESLGDHVDPGVELATRTLEAVVASHGPTPFAALRAYRPVFERLGAVQTSPALLAASGPLLVKIALDVGEREWARDFADELSELALDAGGPALLRALLLVDAGNLDGAAQELRPVLSDPSAWHAGTAEIRGRVLAAEIERRRDNDVRALEHLRAALAKAEPICFVRPFLEHRTTAAVLRSAHGRFGRTDSFVQVVLDAASRTEHSGPDATARLTPRELDVLRELPAPLSLEQIAEARGVSVNTIKTQLQAIYRKLDVHKRREAVVAGRRRGLL